MLVGMQNGAVTWGPVRGSLGVRVTIRLRDSFWFYIQEKRNHVSTYVLFTATLSKIQQQEKKKKQCKRPSIDEEINKTWHSHIMGYYLAINGANMS